MRLNASTSSVSTSDALLASVSVPAIAAGNTYSVNQAVTIPSSATSGQKYVWAILDTTSSAGQGTANEANDKSYTGFNVTVAVTLPDLIAQNLAVNPTSGNAGSAATVTLTVRNQGGSAASASTMNLRLNASTSSVSTSDALLATVSIPAIAAGSTYSVNQAVTIPSNATSGQKYVWSILDTTSSAGQGSANEANDKNYTGFNVTGATVVTGFLAFPIQGLTPSTANISSVFDHLATANNYPGTGVMAYTGENGTVKDTTWSTDNGHGLLYGYKLASGAAFTVNGHYTGGGTPGTLYYEGHTGYDFPYSHSYEVVAAAAGTVHKLNDAYNTIYIDHANGYSTFYLHMAPADTVDLVDGATVSQGQHLGYCGTYGAGGNHLHFTVKKDAVQVDPYGWSGSGQDPYYTRFGVENESLWDSNTSPGTTVELSGVPYIHQVYDTADNFGANADSCNVTAALMAIQYYGKLAASPITCTRGGTHTSNYGFYISNTYNYNGHTYNIPSSSVPFGASDAGYYGGFGYFLQDAAGDSSQRSSRLSEYISYHGLTSSVEEVAANAETSYSKICAEIDAGYPVVILTALSSSGHYVTCIGYVEGQHALIFNDPYGNGNATPYLNNNGARVLYDWPGHSNGYRNLGTVFRIIYARGSGVNTVAPSFTAHPSAISVTVGQTAAFTATATGTPTPTYQWQVSTNSGGTWANVTTGTGGTSTTYTTPVSVIGDNGKQYRCVATNSVNFANSNAATLTVTETGSGPANDNFSNRISIVAPVLTVTGSNISATKETGEPNHVSTGGASVWWTWTAPASGSTTISTAGSSFDTLLAVYTGTAVTTLSSVASNDDEIPGSIFTSLVTFNATSGTQYQIAVDGYNGETGSIQLCITSPTPAAVAPTVTTAAASALGTTTATSGGNVTADGGATVTARGVCWGTSLNPTTANSKTTDGTGTGVFASALTGLTPGTLYHIRAYATNSAGTAYGSDLTFTTTAVVTTPTVTTTAASAPGTTTATSGGNVTADGGATVTARGVCWSTSLNPTTANSKTTDGTGTGIFSSALTGLTPGTLYHIRAYATNSAGTAYGSDLTFTTAVAVTTPTVTTTAASALGTTTATSGGNVTADGGATVTARGVCWGTSLNPTTANSKTTDGTGTGAFSSALTGLTPGTLYHTRAYATNSAGTAYGNDLTFTAAVTVTIPTVTTTAASALGTTTATSGGNVTADGGATVTARGVCWGTSLNPTTANSKTTDGTGTGAFASALTSLIPGTLYHIRAYATNSAGTAYGSDLTFTTATTPTVTITATDANAAEPSNNGEFTLTRTGSTASALTVNLSITGAATNGTDYQTIAATKTIPAGQSAVTIPVTVIANTPTTEPAETVVATVTAGTGYSVGSPSSATVTIAPDGGGSVDPAVRTISGDTVTVTATPDVGVTAVAIEEQIPAGLTPAEISSPGVWNSSQRKISWIYTDGGVKTVSYRLDGAEGTYSVSGIAVLGITEVTIGGDTVFTISSKHPADNSPADWEFGLVNEVMAYIWAYQHGENWNSGPVSIPLLYVMNAIYCYQRGPGYTRGVGTEPNCWQPVTGAREMSASRAGTGITVRAVAGDTVTVTATPDPDVTAVAIEENIPVGVTPEGISAPGVWNASQRKISWIYTDGGEKVVTYRLAGDDGNYTLSGIAVFGIQQVDTGGDHTVVIGTPHVQSLTSPTGNGSYKAGAQINVSVNFSENVTLAGGNLILTLDSGGTVQITPFTNLTSASGAYTVAGGQNSADLNVTNIALGTGATLKNGAGTDVSWALPVGHNLADNSAIVVDTNLPAAPTGLDLAAADDTGTLNSDNITKNTSGLTISGAAEAGSTVKLSDGTRVVLATGTAANFANPGLDIALPAGVNNITATATDVAGNESPASTALTITVDTTAPTSTIALANGQGDPTATKPVHFAVTFNENVTGFAPADIVFTGSTAPGTLAVTVTGGPAGYDVAVDGMTGAGNVVIGFAAGAAQDTAGNASAAPVLTDNTIVYDPTGLSVAVNQATGQADPATGAADILFTAVFNKPVADFATGDVTLSGTAGGLGAVVPTVAEIAPNNGTTYQVSVPVAGITANGTVIATVPAGVAQDAAANPNLASTSTDNVVTFDRTRPTAANKTVATNEDTDFVFVAGDFNFADADTGDTLQAVELATLPVAGTLKVNGANATAGQQVPVATINAGQVTFHPALYANGSPYAMFTFKVSDGTLWSTAAYTMTVNVTPGNNAPVITASSITAAGLLVNGGNITVSVTANDNIDDPDGSDNALIQYSYEWVSGETVLQSTAPKLGNTDIYNAPKPHPTLGANYPVTVTVTVHDPQEPTNVTVQAVVVKQTYVGNEPPVVSASSPASPQNINEGASLNFSATFTDFGHSPQDDGIKSIVWTVTGLTKTGRTTNYTLAYTSPQTDTFTLVTNNNDVTHAGSPLVATVTATATDGMSVTGQQTWTINVADLNTLPLIGTTTVAITKTGGTGLAGAPGKEDTLTATVTPGATDADTEDVATLRYRVVWTDNTARAILKTTDLGVGVYTTTLSKAEHHAVRGRVITATVYALDSQSATSPTSAADTPPITIADTAPVGVADTGTGTEDETLVFDQARAQATNVLNNDTDVDKVDVDVLSVSAVNASSAKGAAVSKSGNVITYDPRNAAQLQSLQVGDLPPLTTDTFDYTVADSFGGSATATVTVTVNGVNDAPFWPDTASLDGTDADGTVGDTKKYTATVTGGDPDDVDHDDEFVGGGRNGGTTLKIFYAWTNVVNHDVVYMDGSTVLSGFDPFARGRTTLFDQIPVGTHKSTAKDNVPRSETWRVEAFVIDQRDAISEVPLTVYFGSPQWYPRFAWTAKPLPGREAADATWYNVQIWNGVPDAPGAELVLDTNVQGTEMTPAAYFSAGSEGLLPDTYYWRYRAWDPVADVYGATWSPDSVRGSEQRIVDDYGYAAKPHDLAHTDNDNGNYTLGFTADNARGYELTITGPNGYARTFLHIFAPDATGVIPLNQPDELDINLVTAGTYTWQVRGFNPIDDSDGTETWSDTAQIVTPGGPPPEMPQPGGLQPPNGSLFRAPGEILLQWDSVPGAAGYLLYLGSSDGHLPYNYADIGDVTSLRVNVLVGSYFWTVIAYDDAYAGSRPSAMARFDVIQNAGAPVIQHVRVDADPTVLTIGVADGTDLPQTVDIRHFDADSGQWRTYLAQVVVGVTATEGTVTIDGADFDDGEYVMISGTSAAGDVSPNKVLVIE